MKITFIGSGDAFGSGGRFNTCFHVSDDENNFLIDCGASSLIALKRGAIDRNLIGTIFITHFHGDHFGGIPYFILDGQFVSKRESPLTIAGPPGLAKWFRRVMETTFPGSSVAKRKFKIELIELEPRRRHIINGIQTEVRLVRHGPPSGPFLAYRLSVNGKTIAYTGDTEWVDDLIEIGHNADLMIAEAYFYDKKVPLHLDLATLQTKLRVISPKQLLLTHMSDDMLARMAEIPFETAADGKVLEL